MKSLALSSLLLWSTALQAHAPSTAYVTAEPSLEGLRLELKLDLRDAARAVNLDRDRDGRITWGELKKAETSLNEYAEANLILKVGSTACALNFSDLAVDKLSGGTFAVLTYLSPCDAQALSIRYDLFFALDADHRAIVRAGNSPAGVLTDQRRDVELAFQEPRRLDVIKDFVAQGVLHIWEGFDHLLFLVALLLPAVFRRSRDGTKPHDTFGRALIDVLKLVTAFTVAHSVTLILVTLGYFSVPTRLVEAVIALSILVTALNNLRPVAGDKAWAIAGGFGLIHGCSFASVLSDLGLTKGTLVTSLIAFNVGVELGQAMLVILILPLCFAARRTDAYRTFVLKGGSIAAAALSAVWMAERIFDFKVLPF